MGMGLKLYRGQMQTTGSARLRLHYHRAQVLPLSHLKRHYLKSPRHKRVALHPYRLHNIPPPLPRRFRMWLPKFQCRRVPRRRHPLLARLHIPAICKAHRPHRPHQLRCLSREHKVRMSNISRRVGLTTCYDNTASWTNFSGGLTAPVFFY